MLNISAPIDNKSDKKANEFRESGNAQYIMKKYSNALIFYNKSITYACSKQVLSLGYANRSAVFFVLEYYEESLKNIEWARENDYPRDKMSKLDKREEKCKIFMLEGKKNIAEDPWNFFKLSYPANEKIPWIVDRLEARTTKKYGRGIYATKNLIAGDVISIEQPVIHFSVGDGYYKHCNNCYKTAMMNLIPCIQTASMMFCSAECMEDFYSKSVDMELALNVDMKMLSEVASSFGGCKKFDNFINKTDLKDLKKTIFDFDLSNPKESEYDKKIETCFLSLSSKIGHSVNDNSCNIFNHVSKKTANHLLSLLDLNIKDDYYFSGKLFEFPFSDGVNISLFRSLINHSCLPNIFFVSIDNKIVGFVTKPIKAGEQLFCCYFEKGPFNYHAVKKLLMEIHNFRCDCQECIYNNYRFKLSMPHIILMNNRDFGKAKELLKKGWDILNSGSEENIDHEKQNFLILCSLAYHVTFPY